MSWVSLNHLLLTISINTFLNLDPTTAPRSTPSGGPRLAPSSATSEGPSDAPSFTPSLSPTSGPTTTPSAAPSQSPTAKATPAPTPPPTSEPTPEPTPPPTPATPGPAPPRPFGPIFAESDNPTVTPTSPAPTPSGFYFCHREVNSCSPNSGLAELYVELTDTAATVNAEYCSSSSAPEMFGWEVVLNTILTNNDLIEFTAISDPSINPSEVSVGFEQLTCLGMPCRAPIKGAMLGTYRYTVTGTAYEKSTTIRFDQ